MLSRLVIALLPRSKCLNYMTAVTICSDFGAQENKGFPGGSVVKSLPAKQETWVPSLDREDPLEKEMATHSSILAWETPWTEKAGRL